MKLLCFAFLGFWIECYSSFTHFMFRIAKGVAANFLANEIAEFSVCRLRVMSKPCKPRLDWSSDITLKMQTESHGHGQIANLD